MILCFVFSALIVALDQFFKQWIVRTIGMGEKGPEIIPGILGLTHWENDGAMLNFLSGQQWLLAGVALLASILLVMIILRYNEGFWGTLGLAAVLGGTVGNLFDRLFNGGKVIDMFRTLFINFPIFNIADIFITLGFFTFLIHFIALTVKVSKEGSQADGSRKRSSGDQSSVSEIDVSGFSNNAPAYSEYGQSPAPATQSHVAPVTTYNAAPAAAAYDTHPAQPYAPAPVAQPYAPAGQPYAVAPPAPPYAPSEQPYAPPAGQPYAAPPAAEDYISYAGAYDPATDSTPEISLTMEALEAELGSLDVDYDVDELLREYGIEDDDINV